MKTIIDESECRQLSNNIKGKLVVINLNYFTSQWRDARYQLVLATAGSGCDANDPSGPVYIQEVQDDCPEHYSIKRSDLIGEPTDLLIKEWKAMYGSFNRKVKMIMEERR
jgi:hypothetical protein